MILVLFVQDVVWIALNRAINSEGWFLYSVSDFQISIFGILLAAAIIFSVMGAFFCQFVSRFPRIIVGSWFSTAIFIMAIAANATSAGFLSEGARYDSGELTGVAGVIYALSRSLSLMAMILAVRGKYGAGHRVNVTLLTFFAVSMAITIDGLAVALTISAFLFVMFKREKGFSVIFLTIFAAGVIGIFYVGFWAKFAEVPSYLTPEFAFRWSVSRMAISSESLYTYLSGESLFNEPMAYIELLERSYFNRYQILTGQGFVPVFPRSISEGLYMDMYGVPGAGSSPGFYLGVLLHGIFAPAIIFVFVWLFMQMFYGIGSEFSYTRIFALSLILKAVHANITEYLIIISPSMIIILAFLAASLLEVRVNAGPKVARERRRR